MFTDRPFTGNPLAVLVDPPELTDAQTQRIAAELNLSETVFVRRPTAGGDAVVLGEGALDVPPER